MLAIPSSFAVPTGSVQWHNLIGTLPIGFPPVELERVLAPTGDGKMATLIFEPTGSILINEIEADGKFFLDQVCVPVSSAGLFMSGPY